MITQTTRYEWWEREIHRTLKRKNLNFKFPSLFSLIADSTLSSLAATIRSYRKTLESLYHRAWSLSNVYWCVLETNISQPAEKLCGEAFVINFDKKKEKGGRCVTSKKTELYAWKVIKELLYHFIEILLHLEAKLRTKFSLSSRQKDSYIDLLWEL